MKHFIVLILSLNLGFVAQSGEFSLSPRCCDFFKTLANNVQEYLLRAAAYRGDVASVEYYARKGVNLNAKVTPSAFGGGFTALHYAAMGNKPLTIMTLMHNNADPQERDVLCGQTALEWAEELSLPEATFALLATKKQPADLIKKVLKQREKKLNDHSGNSDKICSMLRDFEGYKNNQGAIDYPELVSLCDNYEPEESKKLK